MTKALTLEEQGAIINWRFPNTKCNFIEFRKLRILTFHLLLKPTPSSDSYLVCFAYALRERPLVFIKNPPPVAEVAGRRTPHLNQDGTLCLFDSAKPEWTAADSLADTIVPWSMRWLFHYEYWITFGEWRGDAPQSQEPIPSSILASAILS